MILFSIGQVEFISGDKIVQKHEITSSIKSRTLPDNWNETSHDVTEGWYWANFKLQFSRSE